MSTPNPDPLEDRRALLSALMDGDEGTAEAGCRLWRCDAGARADWHAYHVIGDLMRSDEIVCDASHDARLLKRWRERMASDPVLPDLSPVQSRPEPVRGRRVRAWMAPAAIAAGFAVVAVALVVTRLAAPDGAAGDRGSVLAGTVAPPAAAVLPVAAQGAQEPSLKSAADVPQMIRSAELDRYLAAHRQYANGAVQVAPGGGVRNAAAVAPGR